MRKPDISAVLPSLFAGVVVGLSAIISGIGVAALAFPGPLQADLFTAAGYVLFGGAILLVVVALASSLPGAVALPQEASAAILGLLGLALHEDLSAELPQEAVVPAVLAAMALCTILTGLTFALLGHFRLGGLIRFIPYPVVGGVLAGLGWLMVQGGISVLTGDFLTVENLSRFSEPGILLRAGVGLAMAATVFLVVARWKHFLALPATLATGVAAFYLVAGFFTSPDQLMSGGWLLGPYPDQTPWRPLAPSAFLSVDWQVWLQQLPTVGTLVLVSSISILLYASGIEVEVRRDMDLNRELKACGLANVLCGIAGGLPGFHSMSDTILAREMLALRRLTAIVAAAFLIACLFLGFEFLAWMPRAVLGGLLLFLGLGLLYNWVIKAKRQLPTGDWIIILLILAVSASVGYLEAISVGIVAGVCLFVFNYSRISATRHVLDGSLLQSNYDRSARARRLLNEYGEAIQIVSLQGYLFFGTANRIFEQLRERIWEQGNARKPVRFVVLDFRHVDGIDSSALLIFRKLLQFAEDRAIQVVFADLNHAVRRVFKSADTHDPEERRIRIETDLDHGLQWCEEQLLATLDNGAESHSTPEAVTTLFASPAFANYLEPVHVGPGDVVIRQGAPSDDLYLVREGEVTVRLDSPEGKRLRTYGPGTVIGEVALYLRSPRTAWVVADTTARLDRLSRPALERMAADQPELLASVHEALATLVCERLSHTNRLLHVLT